MPAYCVGRIHVRDAAAWEDYKSRVGATIVQYGGEVLFRGVQSAVFCGADSHENVVVLRFDNEDAAKRWHDSPEYQALIPTRDRGADVNLVLYRE
jgi:uncharacterized protein (DUF1330 family)